MEALDFWRLFCCRWSTISGQRHTERELNTTSRRVRGVSGGGVQPAGENTSTRGQDYPRPNNNMCNSLYN